MSAKFVMVVLVLLVALGAAGTVAYVVRPGGGDLQATKVESGPAVEAVYATAVVEPVRWAAISPVQTGLFTEILVEEGYRVGANVTLAKMDTADLQAQKAEQESLVAYRASQLRRAEKLRGEGHVSKEDYELALTDMAQAEARLSVIEEQISRLILRAPISGTVLWRDVEPGEVRQAGEPVFWVGDPKPLRLVAEVDEEDIPRIRPHQDVLITADAFPGKVMRGTVSSITPMGDPVNKSYRVYVALPDDTPLMIGMTVETNALVEYRPHTLLVPSTALVDGGTAVWKLSGDDKAGGTFALHRAPVKTGIRGPRKTEILEGLEKEDLVVTTPEFGLMEGRKVHAAITETSPDSVQALLLTEQEEKLKKPPPDQNCANGVCESCAPESPTGPESGPIPSGEKKTWPGTAPSSSPSR